MTFMLRWLRQYRIVALTKASSRAAKTGLMLRTKPLTSIVAVDRTSAFLGASSGFRHQLIKNLAAGRAANTFLEPTPSELEAVIMIRSAGFRTSNPPS
jgi:hypothetical protein